MSLKRAHIKGKTPKVYNNAQINEEQANAAIQQKIKERIRPIMIMSGESDTFDPFNMDKVEFNPTPDNTTDVSTRMQFTSHSEDDEWYPQDITQMAMMKMASWPDAVRDIVSIGDSKRYDYTNSIYSMQVSTAIHTTICARLNYLINNSLNILVGDIVTELRGFNIFAEVVAKNPALLTELGGVLCQELFALTSDTVSNYVSASDPVIKTQSTLFLNNADAKGDKDLDMKYKAMTYTMADVGALKLTAEASNIVYNVLFRYLSIAVDTDCMQYLAQELTQAFIRFRNTVRDIYQEIYIEIAACDINIDPNNVNMIPRGSGYNGYDDEE